MTIILEQMTLNIPQGLTGLSLEERDGLIQEGLYEAVRARIRRIKTEIAESNDHLRQYEEKYKVSLNKFEAENLNKLDTLEAHDDYNEWFFWNEVLSKNQNLLAELEKNTPG